MPRWLGVDPGERRIGLAVSDPDGVFAHAREVLEIQRPEEAVSRICEAFRRLGAEAIVVGLPLNMDGTRGPAATRAETLAQALRERLGVQVETWDERLTSLSAHGVMREAGMRGERRKGVVDKVAAQILLQSFLDARGAGRGASGERVGE